MLNKGQKVRKKKSAARSPDIDAWLSHTEQPEDDDVLDVESTEIEPPPGEGFGQHSSAFLSARDRLHKITGDFRRFCQCHESDQQLELLGQMQEQIKAVRGVFLSAELSLWARFTSAISTFLFATAQKPGFLTFSSSRTMASALELLTRVVVSGSNWRGIDPGPITALILDPDEASRQALQVPMLSQGMKLAECETVDQALLCLQENAFDVIFSDIALAVTNGSPFAKELRSLRYHYATPLILVTSKTDFGNHSAATPNGASDFIAKPIAPTEVVVKALAFGLRHRVDAEQDPAAPRQLVAISERATTPPADVKPQDEAINESLKGPEVIAKPAARAPAQSLRPVEPEIASRAIRPRSAVERTAELERAQKALNHDLTEALRRETQLKHQISALEGKLEDLDKVLAKSRLELSQESDRRLAAEHHATKIADERGLLQKELDARALEPQSAQKRVAELEKQHHSVKSELSVSLQREDRLKQQCSSLKQECAAANRTLSETRHEMEREQERRQSIEEKAAQLTSRVQELTQKEGALRQELEQSARDHLDEKTQLQAALRKEVAGRHQAEKAVSDLSTQRTKLEKKLADNSSALAELSVLRAKLEKKLADTTAQAEKAQERVGLLEKTQKAAQSELEEILERRREIEKQSAALAEQMDSLGRTLKGKGA
jgi:DNA-binding response OmpR family regulator